MTRFLSNIKIERGHINMFRMNLFIRNDANNRYYFLIKIDYGTKELVSSSYESMQEIYRALIELRRGSFTILEHFGYYYITVLNDKHQIICTSNNFDAYESCASFIDLLSSLIKSEGEKLCSICENLLK